MYMSLPAQLCMYRVKDIIIHSCVLLLYPFVHVPVCVCDSDDTSIVSQDIASAAFQEAQKQQPKKKTKLVLLVKTTARLQYLVLVHQC